MYTVADAKGELEGMLGGTSLSQIQNVNGVLYRAARKLLLDVDAPDTIRQSTITNPIADKIYEYPLPSDLKGNKIIDIRPITIERLNIDNSSQLASKQFDLNKDIGVLPSFQINNKNALKTLRAKGTSDSLRMVVETFDSLTATNIVGISSYAPEYINVVEGAASFKAIFTGNGSFGWAPSETLDLSSYVNAASFYIAMYCATAPTSITLGFGSDSSNLFQITSTQTQAGTTFQEGWNIVSFDWRNAVATGSPSASTVTYFQINMVTTAQTLYFDSLTLSPGALHDIIYYSKYLFRTAAGVWQETITSVDNSEIVNLDTDGINLWLKLCAGMMLQQSQARMTMGDSRNYFQEYAEDKKIYTNMYPSQAIKMKQTYYTMPRENYIGLLGRY